MSSQNPAHVTDPILREILNQTTALLISGNMVWPLPAIVPGEGLAETYKGRVRYQS